MLREDVVWRVRAVAPAESRDPEIRARGVEIVGGAPHLTVSENVAFGLVVKRIPKAERERRAKVVNAEGEFQAAEKMVQAAAMISAQPIALQLRFLQTMREISSEHNTTTFLPVPIDLFSPFLKK